MGAGNKKMELSALSSLARAYSAEQYPDLAVNAANDALSLSQQLGLTGSRAIILELLAKIHLSARQPAAAKEAANEAVAVFKANNDSVGVQGLEKLLANIAVAAEKEVETKKDEAEKYETRRDMEMLSLRKCAEAAMKRDYTAYRIHFQQLKDAQTITDQDWSEAFAFTADDEEMQEWVRVISQRMSPGQHHKIISNEMIYHIFRVTGMHYGPGFRLNKVGAYTIDKHPIKDINTFAAYTVLPIMTQWDHIPAGEDWEMKAAPGHAGILDCALQAGAVQRCLKYDDEMKWWDYPELWENGPVAR